MNSAPPRGPSQNAPPNPSFEQTRNGMAPLRSARLQH